MSIPSNSPSDPDDCATTWFLVLEMAIQRGDGDREKLARRELARLGWAVWLDEDVAATSQGKGATQ